MVSYRETFKQSAQVQGKFSRQSGGRGQYGDVHIEFTQTKLAQVSNSKTLSLVV